MPDPIDLRLTEALRAEFAAVSPDPGRAARPRYQDEPLPPGRRFGRAAAMRSRRRILVERRVAGWLATTGAAFLALLAIGSQSLNPVQWSHQLTGAVRQCQSGGGVLDCLHAFLTPSGGAGGTAARAVGGVANSPAATPSQPTSGGVVALPPPPPPAPTSTAAVAGPTPEPPRPTAAPTPPSTPPPNATPTGSSIYNFEDGTTQGWSVNWGSTWTVTNSPAIAFDGTRSLAVHVNENAAPAIATQLGPFPGLQGGKTLTQHVYLPAGAAGVMAQPVVMYSTSSGRWDAVWGTKHSLSPGWNTVTLLIPNGVPATATFVGVQISEFAGWTGTVNVDAVGW